MKVKALGQTVEHNGEVVIVVRKIPVDCLVLFVSKEVWAEIKDTVEVEEL